MNILRRILFALVTLVAAVRLVAAEPAPPFPKNIPPGVEIKNDIPMGKGGNTTLYVDLAWPKDRPKEPLPILVWVHGGAWTGQHRRTSADHRLWFATQGYVTAAIDYRLAGINGKETPDEAKWPAQIEDLKFGLRWLRAHAKEYNFDPDKLCVWGPSAGGHLVSCLGTMDSPSLEGDSGLPHYSSKVQAVIDMCGPVDFSTFMSAQNLFGFSYAKNPQAWKDASPINHIKASDPAFLVIHGDADESVPYEQSVLFVAALKKAGVQAELYTVPGGHHSMGQRAHEGATPAEWAPVAAKMLQFLDHQFKGK